MDLGATSGLLEAVSTCRHTRQLTAQVATSWAHTLWLTAFDLVEDLEVAKDFHDLSEIDDLVWPNLAGERLHATLAN